MEKEGPKFSGKTWLQVLKKGAGIAVKATSVVLSAPIKLPAKLLSVLKYLALAAGIVQSATGKEDE